MYIEQPNKMWSGRFRERLNRTSEQWQRSFPFDWRTPLLLLFASTSTVAQVRQSDRQPSQLPCSQPTIDHLENESDTIRDWAKLRDFYHRYSVCKVEDAEVQEGVSESVVRILIDHWSTLPTAHLLFARDPAFKTFALSGINVTDLMEDLQRIDTLAKTACPTNLHKLCTEIRYQIRTSK